MGAGSAAGVGLADWSVDPLLALLIGVAALYAIGSRRTATASHAGRERRARAVSFYAAMVVLAIALDSPLEKLSQQLFWVHMIQHVLLLAVAPPLLVAARPWMRLWRALPLGARRDIGRGLAQGRGAAPLRRAGRWLGRPSVSFALFAGVLIAWHVPAAFDATLRSTPVHVLEHSLFFATALLFWKQVIHSPPLHATLGEVQRVAYLVGAMIVTWALAVVLALAPHPLYTLYVHEAVRPGGLSALGDQQLAAGVMWVPGSIPYLIVLFIYVQRWLAPAPPVTARASRLAGGH